jgi:hypothetical protein
VPDDVKQLLATEAALDKLGARGISTTEAGQTLWNRHVVIKNSGVALSGPKIECLVGSGFGPEAIREHAERASLAADEIIPVADTVVVRADPQSAAT